MKVLLLGGTGTLSSAVLHHALIKGYEVIVMNRGNRNSSLPNNVKPIICNYYDSEDVKSKFADLEFDVVVDFLARRSEDIARIYPIFKNHCKQYIFISSSCVYRRAENDFPIKETSTKPNQNWTYNIQKYEAEQLLMSLTTSSKTFYTIIRPYITYNDERIPLGIAPVYKYHRTIIERIKAGKPWFIWDGGKGKSTLTYADEFAVGVVGLFLNERAVNTDFHITSGFEYTQEDIVKLLYNKLHIPFNVVDCSSKEIADTLPEYKEMLMGDRALDAIFDNSKILDAVPELEFKVSFEKGLDRIIGYWNSLTTYEYDYQFDARIDFLLSKKGADVGFVKYPHTKGKARRIYYINRYLSPRWAKYAMRHFV